MPESAMSGVGSHFPDNRHYRRSSAINLNSRDWQWNENRLGSDHKHFHNTSNGNYNLLIVLKECEL